MSPPQSSRTLIDRSLSRRRLLTSCGVVLSGSVAGCGESLPTTSSEGEGDAIEVIVENRTDERHRVGVLIEDESGDTLVGRVYDLEAGHLDSSTGIDTRPATVTAFISAGASSTWQYAPESEFDCAGVDIGISVTENRAIESWYGC